MRGGVNIIGVHYRSHDELVEKWNTRRLRVNFNNIFLIATDNFLKTKDDYKRFDALPYPKICFTAKNKNKYPWEVFCPEFVKKTEVGDCLRYTNIWGKRIFEKNFDCVKWLNENENFNN